MVRLSRAAWDHARATLSPRAFRLWVHITTHLAIKSQAPSAEFTPSPSRLVETFGGKQERITALLDEIATAGLFDVIEPRCGARRRPATYRRAAWA